MNELLTRNEAARLLKISTGTLDRITGAGDIAVIRINKRCVRYTTEALEAYVKAQQTPSAHAATPWPWQPTYPRKGRRKL